MIFELLLSLVIQLKIKKRRLELVNQPSHHLLQIFIQPIEQACR